MSIPEYFQLEGGDRMPRIGFGTWQAADDVLEKAVESALEAGYRHFDTARAYENEAALGRALNRWIGGDPERRKQLFVVTKLPPGGNRPELVQEYFDASLRDLNLDYVDLYLIHTPFAFQHVPGDLHPKNPDGSMKVDHSTNLLELWKTLLKLKESGRVRHVGVSNLNAEQLARVCSVQRPACLQVEVHALCQQPALLAAANKLGVPIVAYSPLGSKALADALAAKTGREYPDLLQVPVVTRIAQAHGRTPAQILLRHTLQRGLAAIPKSTNPARIKQNITLWDFELSESELSELAALDKDPRTQDWFLIRTPWPGLCIMMLYLVTIFRWLPDYMSKRPAYDLRRIIAAYNAIQIVGCAYIAYKSLSLGWLNHYKLICQGVDDGPHSLEIAWSVCYGYFTMKLIDLLDTVFFVLRKKQNQVTFLHVYHHFGMVAVSWGIVKWVPGGHATMLVTLNSIVHMVMYGYYLLTIWDESYKQSIWWKKHVTQIQILQFTLLLFHFISLVAWPECDFPRQPAYLLIPQNLFMVILFSDFYYRSYIKTKKS